MPPFHSTAASGTLPIEQTKLATATTGPMSGPHSFGQQRVVDQEQRLPEASRAPTRAIAPAMSRPMTMSRRTAAHSMTKMWLTDVNPSPDVSRRQTEPVPLTRHVHGGVALHRPRDAPVGLRTGGVEEPRAQERAGTAPRGPRS